MFTKENSDSLYFLIGYMYSYANFLQTTDIDHSRISVLRAAYSWDSTDFSIVNHTTSSAEKISYDFLLRFAKSVNVFIVRNSSTSESSITEWKINTYPESIDINECPYYLIAPDKETPVNGYNYDEAGVFAQPGMLLAILTTGNSNHLSESISSPEIRDTVMPDTGNVSIWCKAIDLNNDRIVDALLYSEILQNEKTIPSLSVLTIYVRLYINIDGQWVMKWQDLRSLG